MGGISCGTVLLQLRLLGKLQILTAYQTLQLGLGLIKFNILAAALRESGQLG